MKPRLRRSIPLVLLLLSGCRTELLDLVDLAGADRAALDMARGEVDLADPTCSVHLIQPVVLSGIELVDGTTEVVRDRVARVLVTYPLADGCDAPADVFVVETSGNATDVVQINARIWHSNAACGAVQSYSRVVHLSVDQFSNDMIRIEDGAPGGSLQLTVDVVSAPISNCAARALYEDCANDCECRASDPRTACVTTANIEAHCAFPCSGDADCAGVSGTPEPWFCGGPGVYVCGPFSGICHDSCPFGQEPINCVCRPRRTDSERSCVCDRDCEPGTLCNDTGECIHPCATERECPQPEYQICIEGSCRDVPL